MEEVRVLILPDGRLDRSNTARFLGLSPKTLSEWQRLGKGPASRKVGGRRFYQLEDLKAFVAEKAA